MKNLYTLILLCFCTIIFGQATESFTNLPTASGSSYASRSWTGDNGTTWTALARTDQTINGKAVTVNGTSGILTSPSYSGGIGTLSFSYVRGFTSANARSFGVYVNNMLQATVTVDPNSDVVQTFSQALNISGTVVFEIRNIGAQVKIDDVAWTAGPAAVNTVLEIPTAVSSEMETNPSTSIQVAITNPSATTATTADLVLTSGDPADLGGYTTQTVTFPAGASGMQTINVTITNDVLLEGSEQFVFMLQNISGGTMASAGVLNTRTLTVLDDDLTTAADIRINELDAITVGDQDFLELYSPNGGNFDLTNYVVVFFNGNGDISYGAYDLDGYATDANGLFVLGNPAAPGSPEVMIPNGGIQNGQDAVAIYYADASDFPNGTVARSIDLIDALVYNGADAALASALNFTDPIPMEGTVAGTFKSIQRGSWFSGDITPRELFVLPINLINLTATNNKNTNTISWSTAKEVNNDRFEIMHSHDGRTYEVIGTERGAGQSSTDLEYSYAHEDVRAGVHYYAINQVDYDGKATYYGPVTTVVEGKGISVYPYMSDRAITLTGAEADQTYSIHNLQGQIISNGTLRGNTIDISALPSAMYILTTQGENLKFVKL